MSIEIGGNQLDQRVFALIDAYWRLGAIAYFCSCSLANKIAKEGFGQGDTPPHFLSTIARYLPVFGQKLSAYLQTQRRGPRQDVTRREMALYTGIFTLLTFVVSAIFTQQPNVDACG